MTSLACANTYTVTHARNGGTGSLRWAIKRANAHSGSDRILFDSSLTGSGIRPINYLPSLTDDETTINGDINDDGRPDVVLNGARAGPCHGLVVEGDECVIAGLCIISFSGWGLFLAEVLGCEFRSCHVGVNLAGTRNRPNGQDQIMAMGALPRQGLQGGDEHAPVERTERCRPSGPDRQLPAGGGSGGGGRGAGA